MFLCLCFVVVVFFCFFVVVFFFFFFWGGGGGCCCFLGRGRMGVRSTYSARHVPNVLLRGFFNILAFIKNEKRKGFQHYFV